MTAIGAYAARSTLAPNDAAQVQPSRRPRGDEGAAAAQQPTAGAGRGTFSAKELGRILSALEPITSGVSDDEKAVRLEGVLGDLAAKRAAGEEAVLMVVSVPGGGTMATVMSPGELAAALASDDPNSLGSVTLDDGTTYSFRDMARAELGGREGKAAMTARDTIAAAIADMMAKAAGEEGRDTASSDKVRELGATLAEGAAGEGGARTGGSVSLVALPAKAPGAAGPGGSPLLLDVAA
jgi:hypothetical protein